MGVEQRKRATAMSCSPFFVSFLRCDWLDLHPVVEVTHKRLSHGQVARRVPAGKFPIQFRKLTDQFSYSPEVRLRLGVRWPEPVRIVLDLAIWLASKKAIGEVSAASFFAKFESSMGIEAPPDFIERFMAFT